MRFTPITVVTILLYSSLSFAEDTRLDLPTDEAQKQSLTLIRDIFRLEFAKSAPADKAALGKKLLQQAIETRDDAAAKFVLFSVTIDLAAQVGDAATVIQAVDAKAEAFKIELAATLDKSLDRVSGKAVAQDQRRAVVNGFLRVVDLAGEANDFDLATRAATKAESAAKAAQDLPMLTRAQGRVKETREVATEFQKVLSSQEKLKTAPDDPDASLAVGRFYCFVKSDWVAGVPLLAKGSDPTLKTLAEKELALQITLPDTTTLTETGDGWWGFADKLSGTSKLATQKHAGEFYNRAIPSLSGLNKTRIEKRLSVLTSIAGNSWPPDRLLRSILHPEPWKVDGEYLTSQGKASATLPVNYKTVQCLEIVGKIIPPARHSFRINVGEQKFHFNWDAGGPQLLTPGTEHRITITQKGSEAICQIDGVEKFKVPGTMTGPITVWSNGNGALGIKVIRVVGVDSNTPVVDPSSKFY